MIKLRYPWFKYTLSLHYNNLLNYFWVWALCRSVSVTQSHFSILVTDCSENQFLKVFPVLLLFTNTKEIECWRQWLILGELKSHNLQRISFTDDLSEGMCISEPVHKTSLLSAMRLQSLGWVQDSLAELWHICHSVLQLWQCEGWHKSTSSTFELCPLRSWGLSSQEMTFFWRHSGIHHGSAE